jgi:hypothetical protein
LFLRIGYALLIAFGQDGLGSDAVGPNAIGPDLGGDILRKYLDSGFCRAMRDR